VKPSTQRLRGLLSDGASSPAIAIADHAYFGRLREQAGRRR
jgi:hypothetical protein